MRTSATVDSIRDPIHWEPTGRNESLTLLEKVKRVLTQYDYQEQHQERQAKTSDNFRMKILKALSGNGFTR